MTKQTKPKKNLDLLETQHVAYDRLNYQELDRFVTRHMGRKYRSVVAGEWRNDSSNTVVLDSILLDHNLQDILDWVAAKGRYAGKDNENKYPPPEYILAYIRDTNDIQIPGTLLVTVCI